MLRLIAGTTGAFLFGIIIAEIMNHFGSFDFKLPVLLIAAPLSLGFLFHELIIKRLVDKQNSSTHDESRFQKAITIYYTVLWIIGILAVLGIPFLWWGVIKKLAVLANEGKQFF